MSLTATPRSHLVAFGFVLHPAHRNHPALRHRVVVRPDLVVLAEVQVGEAKDARVVTPLCAGEHDEEIRPGLPGRERRAGSGASIQCALRSRAMRCAHARVGDFGGTQHLL